MRSIDFDDADEDEGEETGDNNEVDTDVNRIGKLETLEQVKKENEMLLQELNSLEKKKRDGYDITNEYQKLKNKLGILKEIKKIIVETEKIRTQNPNIGVYIFKTFLLTCFELVKLSNLKISY